MKFLEQINLNVVFNRFSVALCVPYALSLTASETDR